MSGHFYTGWDRKLVEVLVDGTWHSGLLRSWDQAEDGSWSGMVEWSAGPAENRLDRFDEASVRPVVT
jgi:hypothetical protein